MAVTGQATEYACLPEAPTDWPRWQIDWANLADHVVTGVTMTVTVGGFIELRPDRHFVIATAERPSNAALAHPWLAAIGAWAANDAGFETFHGGGVVVGDRLWVMLGPKEAGKSTTLAALAEAGCVVTSDDLVVLSGDQSLSGPACIDLRQQSAEALGIGKRTQLMPDRVRWRVELPRPPAQVPLAGFVLPTWISGNTSSLQPVPAAQRLSLLFDSRSAQWRDHRGLRMLQLASRPVLCWRRPRALADLRAHVVELIAGLEAVKFD